MNLARHVKQISAATVLRFARPAKKRGDNYLTGRAAPGAGAFQNRFRDVSEHEPAILFSIRRQVAKLDDGLAASRTHDTELRLSARSVAGSVFRMRKRKLVADEVVSEARAWAKELTAIEITGPGDLEPAWRRLETRYGIPYSTFWSLRYQKDLKDVWASIHTMLRLAVEAERARRTSIEVHHQVVHDLIARSSSG
jgi:hypothetical protein